jgi:hypothetical protein
MRRLTPRRLTVAKVVAAVAVFGAIGGVAYASSSSPFVGVHGNINTCVPRSGGEVNVWKPGHNCTGGRVGLAFPTSGAQGAPGAAGAAGPSGPTGPTGATGPTNPNATTVDGETMAKLLAKVPTPATGTTSQNLYSVDGLTVVAQCDSAGNASLAATGPATADSELTVSGYDNAGTPDFGSQTNTLGPTPAAVLGPVSSGHTSFSYANSAGQVVTGSIGYQKAPSLGTYAGCAFFGTLTYG